MTETVVHGLTYSFESYDALANFFYELANRACARALAARTIEDARFDEGQARANYFMAEFFRNMKQD